MLDTLLLPEMSIPLDFVEVGISVRLVRRLGVPTLHLSLWVWPLRKEIIDPLLGPLEIQRGREGELGTK